MQHEEVVKEWIEKAEEDFSFASSALGLVNYFLQICFHFHQAAEKYLKAFIIANELQFRPVHNLMELLEIRKDKEPRVKDIEEDCRYLNPFYIETRYPVHWPTRYDEETAIKARDSLRRIRDWIREILRLK